ncbi:MAG TPA: hypothetical protein DCP28_08145 [Cytophagales bacterium]|nr:hypothetical protein [Cytophagales bacterium]
MKIVFSGLLVALLVLNACQEPTEPNLDLNQNSPLVNGVLYFENLEDYNQFLSGSIEDMESFFDEREAEGFTSYADAFLTEDFELVEGRGQEPLIDDPVFSRMVSKESIIKIGPWYLRLNKPEDKVYALHESQFAEHHQDLVNQNTELPNLLIFSTDTEVLEELQGLDGTSTMLGRGELFCDGAPGNSETDNRSVTGATNAYQFDTFLRYYRYGIGFALYVQVKWRYRTPNDIFNEWDRYNATNIVATYQRSYTVKCGKKPGREWNTVPLTTTPVSSARTYTLDLYRAGNRLSAYRAEARVTYTVPDTPFSNNTIRASTDLLNIRYPN